MIFSCQEYSHHHECFLIDRHTQIHTPHVTYMNKTLQSDEEKRTEKRALNTITARDDCKLALY